MRYNFKHFSEAFSRRMVILGGVKLGLFSLLGARIGWLQISEGKKYFDLAEGNRIDVRFSLPNRGRILTQDFMPIADVVPKFQLVLIPYRVKSLEKTLFALSNITPLSPEKITEILDLNKHLYRYAFVPIKILDSWEEATELSRQLYNMPGIDMQVHAERVYPFLEDFCHVTGYIGAVSKKDKEENNDPMLGIPAMKIGKQGLEKQYDSLLRGRAGEHHLEVSNTGMVRRKITEKPFIRGKDVNITIYSEIQKTAISAMGEQSGGSVLLNIQTGDVCALASTPGFDPNLFIKGISYDNWDKLRLNPKAPMNNKAIIGQYPPGSTFKMLTLLAALEAGMVTPDESVFCNGHYKLGESKFHCWKYSGHGKVTAIEALKYSCDVYFYELSQRVGIKKIAEMARRYGLGAITNISLPYEKPGLVADPEWKMKRYGKGWLKGETIISSIGQGSMLATPLQLAVMTARLASNKAVLPTLIQTDTPPIFPDLITDPEHLKIVQQGMFDVVNVGGGTTPSGRIPSEYGMAAGKTGTAQVRRISASERKRGVVKNHKLEWKYRDHALYVSFAPYDNPLFAVATVIEHGGSGSRVAAPIATKILEKALEVYI